MTKPQKNEEPLVFAIPSKGRIEEGAREFFAQAGLVIQKQSGARDYRGRLATVPDAEVLFLAAGEIPAALESGTAHLGVTGEDLIRDRSAAADRLIALIMPLGFSHADVVVAVPRAWIDVSTVADLDEVAHDFRARRHRHMRVATKYLHLTRAFFAEHGMVDYRIVESGGATEGAPASGVAEIIVDITTTGATLAANSLKVLEDGVILKSQAQLAASRAALWSPRARQAAAQILETLWIADRDRFAQIRFKLAKDTGALARRLTTAFGAEVDFSPSAGAVQTLRCARRSLNPVYAVLRSAGVKGPIEAESGRVEAGPNRLLETLLANLDGK